MGCTVRRSLKAISTSRNLADCSASESVFSGTILVSHSGFVTVTENDNPSSLALGVTSIKDPASMACWKGICVGIAWAASCGVFWA